MCSRLMQKIWFRRFCSFCIGTSDRLSTMDGRARFVRGCEEFSFIESRIISDRPDTGLFQEEAVNGVPGSIR